MQKLHAETRKSTVARNRCPKSPATSRSATAVEMTGAILLDQKRNLPCAAYLQGEYGLNGLFVGVPVQLGSGGIEVVIELDLSEDERSQLEESANNVRKMAEVLHS